MKKKLVNRTPMRVVGLAIRTQIKQEMMGESAQIPGLIERYWKENIASRIPNRVNPGITLAVYTEYEEQGEGTYTYLIGEEVGSFENIPSSFKKIILPASPYQRFTSISGTMPEVAQQAWSAIAKMSPKELGGVRAFQADFELYDQRAKDPGRTSLDIYIGLVLSK